MLNGKQVTIFGGTGFVGRYLADRLCDLGYTLRIATRRPHSAYFLRTAGFVGQVVPVPCDIGNPDHIRQAIAGSHIVINLVGTLTETKKRSFDMVHRLFPERLAQECTAQGIERLIHVSALVAGEQSSSRYAQSKAKGEQGVLTRYPQAVVLRPSLIFGPEDHFFNRFAQMASLFPVLPLIGGGKTKFQPVYVGDVVGAIIALLTTKKDITGEIFELAGEDQYSFKDLMKIILKQTKLNRRLVPLPFPLAKMKGAVLQYLPGKILTLDQVRSLQDDSILSGRHPGLRDLGISPTPLDAVLPTYLNRFRPGGRFARAHIAPHA